MTKRFNPFGDASPLQYKSHIRTKEVDLGVNSKQNMKCVYDRTKALLFQATIPATKCCDVSKPLPCDGSTQDDPPQQAIGQMYLDYQGRLSDQCPAATTNLTVSQVSVNGIVGATRNGHCTDATLSRQSSCVQLQLDSQGQLCAEQKAARASPYRSATAGFTICQSCNRPSHMTARPCGFCERMTCSNCLRQCHCCQGLFCQLCSVLNYDDSFEKAYCLHCSS